MKITFYHWSSQCPVSYETIQLLKTFEEAKCHYQNYEIVKLDDEIEIDSAMPFESMVK